MHQLLEVGHIIRQRLGYKTLLGGGCDEAAFQMPALMLRKTPPHMFEIFENRHGIGCKIFLLTILNV